MKWTRRYFCHLHVSFFASSLFFLSLSSLFSLSYFLINIFLFFSKRFRLLLHRRKHSFVNKLQLDFNLPFVIWFHRVHRVIASILFIKWWAFSCCCCRSWKLSNECWTITGWSSSSFFCVSLWAFLSTIKFSQWHSKHIILTSNKSKLRSINLSIFDSAERINHCHEHYIRLCRLLVAVLSYHFDFCEIAGRTRMMNAFERALDRHNWHRRRWFFFFLELQKCKSKVSEERQETADKREKKLLKISSLCGIVFNLSRFDALCHRCFAIYINKKKSFFFLSVSLSRRLTAKNEQHDEHRKWVLEHVHATECACNGRTVIQKILKSSSATSTKPEIVFLIVDSPAPPPCTPSTVEQKMKRKRTEDDRGEKKKVFLSREKRQSAWHFAWHSTF